MFSTNDTLYASPYCKLFDEVGAQNNYCSLDKLPAKPMCLWNNLIQFSPPFPAWDRFAYVPRDYANIYFLTYCLLTPQEEETLRVRILKRFTRFVGSLSAGLICLPLKCLSFVSYNYCRVTVPVTWYADFAHGQTVGFSCTPLHFTNANKHIC